MGGISGKVSSSSNSSFWVVARLTSVAHPTLRCMQATLDELNSHFRDTVEQRESANTRYQQAAHAYRTLLDTPAHSAAELQRLQRARSAADDTVFDLDLQKEAIQVCPLRITLDGF